METEWQISNLIRSYAEKLPLSAGDSSTDVVISPRVVTKVEEFEDPRDRIVKEVMEEKRLKVGRFVVPSANPRHGLWSEMQEFMRQRSIIEANKRLDEEQKRKLRFLNTKIDLLDSVLRNNERHLRGKTIKNFRSYKADIQVVNDEDPLSFASTACSKNKPVNTKRRVHTTPMMFRGICNDIPPANEVGTVEWSQWETHLNENIDRKKKRTTDDETCSGLTSPLLHT